MRRSWVLVMVLCVCIGLSACGNPAQATGDPAKGKELFTTGGASGVPCSTCHTLDGSQLVGPSLKGIGERAGGRVPGLSAEAYIRQSIVSPSSYMVEGFSDLMYKKFGETLSKEDIDNLVAFLMTQ